MSGTKGCAQTEREATNAMFGRSLLREQSIGGDKLLEKYREERHRETLYMLDRIATALEVGNRLTTDVMEKS